MFHGVHRVGTEIHGHLMQLGRIADERGIAGGEGFFQPDIGGQRGRDEFQSFFDDRLDVDARAFTEAAAAESENAIDEGLGAPGRVHHIVKVAAQRGVRRRLLLRELAVTQDRTEYIVEIVGDTACLGTHRLHLLRLPQLRFQ
jgi:hypothetical protein